MITITQYIENYFGTNVSGSREHSLNFYKRIIEDLIREPILNISYDEKMETIKVIFVYLEKELLINIRMDSLTAATNDVIRQAINFRDKN